MKKIKVGQIGKGSFGKKILSKLEKMSDVSVEWVYGSKDKWWESDVDLDWVIIVSPNEFHYEQAKYYFWDFFHDYRDVLSECERCVS